MRIRPWFLLAVVAAAGCGGYSADDNVTFGQLVYTQPAQNANFSSYTNYFIDPTLEVWEDGAQRPSQTLPTTVSQTIDTNMQKYGFHPLTTKPPAGTASTVGIQLVYLKSNYTYYVGGGYCSIYWYYACYPGWAYAGSYSTGTVLMMMVDLSGAANTSEQVVWGSAMYAVLGATGTNNAALVTSINRSFDQSKYLAH